jgi:hypothetical protein
MTSAVCLPALPEAAADVLRDLVLGRPGVFAMASALGLGVALFWVALGRREWSWWAALASVPGVLAGAFVPSPVSWGISTGFMSLMLVAPASLLVTDSVFSNRVRALVLLALTLALLTVGGSLPESAGESCLAVFVGIAVAFAAAPVAVVLLLPASFRARRLAVSVAALAALACAVAIWLLRAHLYRS